MSAKRGIRITTTDAHGARQMVIGSVELDGRTYVAVNDSPRGCLQVTNGERRC